MDFDEKVFISLMKTITTETEGGFDGKIRFPKLETEFCPDLTDQKIFKVDIGPLLLAIKARNTKAVSAILKADKMTNLLESLKGPKEVYHKDYVKKDTYWNCSFSFTTETNKKLTFAFQNLGYALLCDCE